MENLDYKKTPQNLPFFWGSFYVLGTIYPLKFPELIEDWIA